MQRLTSTSKINKSRIYIYTFIISKYNNTTKETAYRVHKNEYYNPILHCVYRDIEGATQYLNILFLSQTHCGIFKHETVFVMEEYLSTVKLFLFRSIMPIQYSFHYVCLLCKLSFEPKYHMDGDEGIYLPIFTFCLSIIHQVPTITRFHFKKKVWISYNFHLLES